jgi:hypothetical protein
VGDLNGVMGVCRLEELWLVVVHRIHCRRNSRKRFRSGVHQYAANWRLRLSEGGGSWLEVNAGEAVAADAGSGRGRRILAGGGMQERQLRRKLAGVKVTHE